MAESPTIQFRVFGTLGANLVARTDEDNQMSRRAATDLERYYDLLQRSMPRLAANEWKLGFDVANGTLWEGSSMGLIWAEVADAIRLDQVDRKWEVDGAVLVEKLRGLPEASRWAVVDTAERFWNARAGYRQDQDWGTIFKSL